MTNEEVLTAFDKFLQANSECRRNRNSILAYVRELAAAIDPVLLEEAADRQIEEFVRDHKVPPTEKRPSALAVLRYGEYRAAMRCFRRFRLSVLKSQSMAKTD